MQNHYWINIFDVIICKGYFTINLLEIGWKESGYKFRIFRIHINRFAIDLQILGIPILILLKSKVR